MIALSFALPEESKGIVALLENRKRQSNGALPRFTGSLGGVEITIVHTGMGQKSAARQMETFLESCRPTALIAAGFGGGLDPALQVGDLFIGANYSSEALIRTLPGKFRTGTLLTTGEVVETREAKADLARRSAAACVDMETAEVFQQCQSREIPMLSVRAISDAADDDLPVPAQVWFDAERQRPRPLALVLHLAAHPGRIAPFARFVKGINRARSALTQFLVEAVARQSS